MKGLYASASLAVLVLATPALAQTGAGPANQASAPLQPGSTGQNESADSQAAATAVPTQDGQLGDIIVTANRRSENLQNVPIAVVAVTPAQLVNSGVSNIQGLATIVPGVQLLQGAATANPYIRGVGSQQVGPGLESPVALYVDGVYYASTFGAPADLNSVQQVEILKGPQGTLFGRNATGGLINITTRTPSHTPHIEANASYGNYDTLRLDAYATTGIGPNLAVDISALYSHQGDGYGTNLLSGQPIGRVNFDLNLRNKWYLTPGPNTRITAIFDYNQIRSSLNSARIIPGTGVPPVIGPLYGGRAWDAALSTEPRLNQEGGGASFRFEQDIGAVTLVDILAYRQTSARAQLDLDATATNFTSVAPAIQHEDQFSNELQLQSRRNSRFTWTLGAYYFDDDARIDETVRLGPLPSLLAGGATGQRYLGKQVTTSYAGYGQGSYEILPDTHLTLGARYTHEERDFTGNTFVLRPAIAIQTLTNFRSQRDYDRFTYRASIDHRFSPELLVYASINSGFKSGGYNALAPTQAPFNPERLTAYAGGIKTDLLNRRVRFNLEGFYYDYQDLQVAVVLQLGNGVTAPGIVNGGSARVYGLDADFTAQVTDHFHLNAGLEYLHSRFRNTVSNFAISSPSGTVPTHLGSVSGNTIPYSPDLVANVAADYTVDIGRSHANLNVTWQFNDGFYPEPDNVVRQGAFSLFNASLRWRAPGDHFSVSVWGKNLTDRAVIQNALTLAFGPHEAYYLPPRTYGATVGFSF